MKIKIVILSPYKNTSVYADEDANDFTIGVNKIDKDVRSFVREAIGIVSKWPELLEDTSVIDGIKYKIAYYDGINSRQFVGINKQPEDFHMLLKLIARNDPVVEEEKRRRQLIEDFRSSHNL